MPLDAQGEWSADKVVPAHEIVERIHNVFPLEAVDGAAHVEPAARWRYVDGKGEVGVIASVTQPFCGDCTRARVSAEGKLYTCLFATRGNDLRALIRGGADDAALADALAGIWRQRADRYSEIRSDSTVDLPKVEMSYIGG